MKTKKKLMWGISFLVLAFFTVYSMFGLFGVGAEKAYAEALTRDGFYKNHRGKRFIVVDKKDKEGGVTAGLNGEQEICTLDNEQVAELNAFFDVDTFNLNVEDSTVTIAAISGKRLTKHQLMDYLSVNDAELDCRLVHRQRVFFLPVLPQVS